jgi:acyl CoA:acetate/3-ketoacid CoA transferase alpha subunit
MRREGEVKILDSTCPAIHAALQAGQKGLPFMPLRAGHQFALLPHSVVSQTGTPIALKTA